MTFRNPTAYSDRRLSSGHFALATDLLADTGQTHIDVRGQNPKVVGEIWPRQHRPDKVLDCRQQSIVDARAANAAIR